jgi:hypothetical protein
VGVDSYKNRVKKEEERKLGVLFTFWWLIWNKRNNRIFDHKEKSALQLAHLIQEEIQLHKNVFSSFPN